MKTEIESEIEEQLSSVIALCHEQDYDLPTALRKVFIAGMDIALSLSEEGIEPVQNHILYLSEKWKDPIKDDLSGDSEGEEWKS